MHFIGIDLGTTNSVVAVEGDYPDKGEKYGNVTVIADDVGRFTQASAVCLVDGELIVGDDAKDLASQGYTPVRFAKKYMGTEERFRVGDEEWSAVKVSSKILERMCQMVTQALGGKVDFAVVTHPAYFDALAINATKEAGKLAGLNVELMMEPIAAAMAYTFEDNSDQMMVLVYDLGGGTFDVTLVERTAGMFQPRAFGGNRELGGYNFDKRIASDMLTELEKKGYVFHIDKDNPERDARWASLMHHAEQLKIALSTKPKAEVRLPSVFRDDSTPPKAVSLSYGITRARFLELIAKELDETMDATRDVLAKANCQPSELDHIVLVGGSSRIPVIQERLEREFGKTPVFDEKIIDLSVAVGAAMAATQKGKQEGEVYLERIPERTDMTTVTISGRVVPSDKLKDLANCVVTIRGGQDEETTTTGANGGFFQQVKLYEDSEHTLEILVEAPDGRQLLHKTVTVHHDPTSAPPPPPPPPQLPRPISVDTNKSLVEIAAEGVPLPYENVEAFVTVEELREIPIDLYQEDVQLSTLILKGFSEPVPANCRLELKLEISADYVMKVTATVPSKSMSKTQEIKLKEEVVPSSTELAAEFKELQGQFFSQLENMPDGDAKSRIAAEGGRLIDDIQELLNARHPERIQISMSLKKLKLTLRQMTSQDMQPPKAKFDTWLADARKALPDAIRKQPALQQQRLDQTLDLLEQQARQAYQSGDSINWSRLASQVEAIKNDLESMLRGPVDLDTLPDPQVLKMFVENSIEELEQTVTAKSRQSPSPALERAKAELSEARRKLAACDLTRGNPAKMDVISIYQQHVVAVEQLMGKASAMPGGGGKINKA
ncbi:MAG TPA: Hsp70 family protein [Planctomycetaceae bacterium]|nr:Hsp70 family protein [Planctomycetaceae bacterium]